MKGKVFLVATAAAIAAHADTLPPLKLRLVGKVETASGYAATLPQAGAGDGAIVTFNAGGMVTALDGEGAMRWRRTAIAFVERTGFPPPGTMHIIPQILMGFEPADTRYIKGEHPFATGDLNGDGVADVAVAHFFNGGAGIAGRARSQVAVLDGVNGEFLWSQLYPGFVTNLAIEGATLVVANETGDPKSPSAIAEGEAGSKSTLYGVRFSGDTGAPVWSFSTNVGWARWLALDNAGAGFVAAAWTDTAPGSTGTHGHVLRVPVATGAPAWDVATDGYPRMLRYDAARGEVVVLAQDDPQAATTLPTSQPGYALLGLTAATGSTGVNIHTPSALALNLTIGKFGWLVGQLNMSPGVNPCNDLAGCVGVGGGAQSGSVVEYDPATGATRWTRTLNAEDSTTVAGAVQPYGLIAGFGDAGNIVVAGSFLPVPANPLEHGPADTRLDGINESDGTVAWSKAGINLFAPVFMSAVMSGGELRIVGTPSRPHLYGANVNTSPTTTALQTIEPSTPYQRVRTFDAGSGETLREMPLLGDVYGAAGADVTGDQVADYFAGGESGGLFAIDGATLADETPRVLWQRALGGPVRQVQVADLDGDRKPELIVAATRSVDVLRADTGAIAYSKPYLTDLVWTVQLADLDLDGRKDLLVPTSTLAAYKGTTGATLWTHGAVDASGLPAAFGAAFSNAAVTSGNQVAVQYLTNNAQGDPKGNQTVELLDGRTGAIAWSHRQESAGAMLHLWEGTVAGDDIPGVDGTAVAFTWDPLPNGTDPQPRIDVYRASDGTLAYSSQFTYLRGVTGSAYVPGIGVEAYTAGNSLLATPTGGGRENLQNYFTDDMNVANFGQYGQRLVLGSFPGGVVVLPTSALTVDNPKAESYYGMPYLGVGVVTQDTDLNCSDEVIAGPFDYDGNAAVQSLAGNFGFSNDAFYRGFTVLTADLPNTAPVASASAAPLSGYAPLDVAFTLGGTDADHCGVLTYELDFGDGSPKATGVAPATVHHVYAAGTWQPTFTLSDQLGATDTLTIAPVVVLPKPEDPPVDPPPVDPPVVPPSGSASSIGDTHVGGFGPQLLLVLLLGVRRRRH